MDGGLIEKKARLVLALAALICGALCVAGWAEAIYAFLKNPEIHEIVLHDPERGQIVADKASILFVPAVLQTWCLFMTLYPNLTWRHFIAKAAKRMRTDNIWKRQGNR